MDLKNYKGVLHGDQVQELFEQAKKHQFALPAVNVIGTNSINAVMETAKAVNSLLSKSTEKYSLEPIRR